MQYIFFFVCALVIAILESVGLTQFFGSIIYDLQIPLIIAVSVLGRVYFSLAVIVPVAIIMDTLSGGPFGIYLTTYVWLFFPIKVLSLLVSTRSWLAVALFSVLGVLFENFIFAFVQLLSSGNVPVFKTVILPLVIRQCVMAFVTGPIIYFLLARSSTWLTSLVAEERKSNHA